MSDRIRDAIERLKLTCSGTMYTAVNNNAWAAICGVLEAAEPININLNYATAQTRLETLRHRLEALATAVLGEGK